MYKLKINKKVITGVVVSVLLLIAVVIVQFNNGKNNMPKGVVVYSDNWQITQAEYEDTLETNEIKFEMQKEYYTQTELPDGVTMPPLEKDTEDEILNKMIEREIIQQKAIELGIKVDYEEAEAEVIKQEKIIEGIMKKGDKEELESLYETQDVLDNWKEKKGMTSGEYRVSVVESYRYFILLGKLKEHVLGDVSLIKIEERDELWDKQVKQWVKESNYTIAK